jgi:aldehyde dehydrogenase (NAD+)
MRAHRPPPHPSPLLPFPRLQVATPAPLLPASSYVVPEPLGVVLIIAPWNFPTQLVFNVVIPAIAAGNAVVIKPSEVSPASAALIEKLSKKYLDPEAIRVVQGAVDETGALLKERFDHIFYTGNDKIARIVMRAAAEHLTPVTLELGGKSPAIVDSTANLDLTAERIIASKCLNDGQVCIAPDYILVEQSVKDKLVDKLQKTLVKFYGEDPQKSPDLGRIVNKNHFSRVKRLLDSAGGKVVHGGKTDEADLYIAPTIIVEPAKDSAILKEEIFGPLLPVLSVGNLEEAVAYVNKGEKPLALYVFSSSSSNTRKVLQNATSGGAVINDCLIHNVSVFVC